MVAKDQHNARTSLAAEVQAIYEEVDQRINSFREASGIECPDGCGACCLSQQVEASVLEALPLGQAIFMEKMEDVLLNLVHERETRGDATCVLYKPDPLVHGHGRCSFYRARPLVCRLFGFATRKNKAGISEFSTCRVLKERFPDLVIMGEKKTLLGLDLPGYQETFVHLASLDPHLGFRRVPVNAAIRAAIEKLYWQETYGQA